MLGDLYTFSVLQVGQELEVRPGIVSKTSDGKIQCKPILSCIVSLFAEQNELQYAVPGGLIGECIVSLFAEQNELQYAVPGGLIGELSTVHQ